MKGDDRILKRFLLTALIFALMVSLVSCSLPGIPKAEDEPGEPDGPAAVVIDPDWPCEVLGTTLDKAPEKVICLSSALCEYVTDMGYGQRLCLVPDGVSLDAVPSAGTPLSPDLDAIRGSGAEYIIMTGTPDEKSLVKIQQMNITVVSFKAPQSLEELYEVFENIALFFDGKEKGAERYEEYVFGYDELLSSVTYGGQKKTAGFIRRLDYLMITSDTLAGDILSLAFDNAAADATGCLFPEENIKDYNPDVIFLGGDLHLEDLETSDIYKKKSAVKGDQVYKADFDLIGLGSRKSFETVRDMMATVYGDYEGGTALEPAYPSIYKK